MLIAVGLVKSSGNLSDVSSFFYYWLCVFCHLLREDDYGIWRISRRLQDELFSSQSNCMGRRGHYCSSESYVTSCYVGKSQYWTCLQFHLKATGASELPDTPTVIQRLQVCQCRIVRVSEPTGERKSLKKLSYWTVWTIWLKRLRLMLRECGQQHCSAIRTRWAVMVFMQSTIITC